MKICSFFGHSDFLEEGSDQKIFMEIIEGLIKDKGFNVFYVGGRGKFDNFCAVQLNLLKNKYTNIKICLVVAYMRENIENKELYDEIIYPSLERVHNKWAISERNKWIIGQSDFLVFYVNRTWGGSYKCLIFAKKNKKNFLNLASINR